MDSTAAPASLALEAVPAAAVVPLPTDLPVVGGGALEAPTVDGVVPVPRPSSSSSSVPVPVATELLQVGGVVPVVPVASSSSSSSSSSVSVPVATELPVVGGGADVSIVQCDTVVEAQLPKQEVCSSLQRAVAALCVRHQTNCVTTNKEIRKIFTFFPKEYQPGKNESVYNTAMNQKFTGGIPKKKARLAIGDPMPSKTMTVNLTTYRNIALRSPEAQVRQDPGPNGTTGERELHEHWKCIERYALPEHKDFLFTQKELKALCQADGDLQPRKRCKLGADMVRWPNILVAESIKLGMTMYIVQDSLVDQVGVQVLSENTVELTGSREEVELDTDEGWVVDDPTPKGEWHRRYNSKVAFDTHRDPELGAHEGMWCVRVFHRQKKAPTTSQRAPGAYSISSFSRSRAPPPPPPPPARPPPPPPRGGGGLGFFCLVN